MYQHDAIALTETLIARPSITPEDAGCQALIAERLTALGMCCEHLRFGDPAAPTDNLWARLGDSAPLLCFAGHTDVVPPGDEARWQSPPFSPTRAGELLYGRGAADMKASLAAMVVAAEQFVASGGPAHGSLAFLLTSDEEGPATDGTVRVMETLSARDEHIDWCVVGEPSSQNQLGDLLRIGRRGSLSGMLTVHGIQGHVAYPALSRNPIEDFAPVLKALYELPLDEGNAHFPPTSFQVVQVTASGGAPNVTPGSLFCRFNFRYSNEWHYPGLQQLVSDTLSRFDLDYSLDWRLSGEPFLTVPGELTQAVSAAVEAHTGLRPELSTGGGTSDGRFIAPSGAQVVELGPVNESIHKVDEHVRMQDIATLSNIYLDVMKGLLGEAPAR